MNEKLNRWRKVRDDAILILGILLCSLGVAALLAGCAEETASPNRSDAVESQYPDTFKTVVDEGSLRMVEMPDGTRCILFYGPEARAIDCDWRHEKEVP